MCSKRARNTQHVRDIIVGVGQFQEEAGYAPWAPFSGDRVTSRTEMERLLAAETRLRWRGLSGEKGFTWATSWASCWAMLSRRRRRLLSLPDGGEHRDTGPGCRGCHGTRRYTLRRICDVVFRDPNNARNARGFSNRFPELPPPLPEHINAPAVAKD